MKRNYLALASIAAGVFLMPMATSALSLTEFNKESSADKLETYDAAVVKATTEAYNKNNDALGDAIKAYFSDKPDGAKYTLGFADFLDQLAQYKSDAAAGKINPDITQVDELVQKVIDQKITPTLIKKEVLH